jgi:hypothetical protein
MRLQSGLAAAAMVVSLGACSADGTAPDEQSTSTSAPTDSPSPSDEPTASASPSDPPTASEPPSGGPTTDPPAEPVRFSSRRAMASVRHLSLRIGPREATSGAFARAADWVQAGFADLGYDVLRQRFRVPAGNSWGIDVPAGPTVNVVAEPAGFDATQPHIIIGAHLDTVPQAPGAEDNASGIAVLLELARMASLRELDVPVRFVAFGAEEPRGEGDDLHHFGSMHYVGLMTRAERRALVGMVSLDRVGTRGPYIPVWSGPGGAPDVRDQLDRSARVLGIEAREFDDNASSDHWSFTKAGLLSARLGSIPYTGYHDETDLPRMVDPTQLDRVARTMWHWLGRSARWV